MSGGSLQRSRMGDLGRLIILVVICLLFVIPIFWIFSTSLKPTSEILVTPTTMFPRHPTLEHYAAAFASDFSSDILINSLIAATGFNSHRPGALDPRRIWLRQVPLSRLTFPSIVHCRLARFSANRTRTSILPPVPRYWPYRQSVGLGGRVLIDCAAVDDLDTAWLFPRFSRRAS